MSALVAIIVSAMVILVASLIGVIGWIIITGWRERLKQRGGWWGDDGS